MGCVSQIGGQLTQTVSPLVVSGSRMRVGKVAMKRADEELCKSQFDLFLKAVADPAGGTWEEVAQGNEPPDYYLLLDDVRFAVEVTTLMEKVSVGTSSLLPRGVIHRILKRFVDTVQSVARADGFLQGNYLVSFPTPIDDFANIQDSLQEALLEYIRRNAGLNTAPQEIVFERKIPQQRPQRCGIQKVNSNRDQVLMGGAMWFKWEGEVSQDVCQLLNHSLDVKASKLKDIADPWILLLLDSYVFADPGDYRESVSNLAAVGVFHTVFIVQGREQAFILHTKDSNWRGVQ